MVAENDEKSSNEDVFEPVISSYTRAQAIEDGVLVDLTAQFPADTRSYKYPVACTESVWKMIEQEAHEDRAKAGAIVWLICHMSAKYPVKKLSESTVLFNVAIGNKTHTLKCNCGSGDKAKPVMTIMQQNED